MDVTKKYKGKVNVYEKRGRKREVVPSIQEKRNTGDERERKKERKEIKEDKNNAKGFIVMTKYKLYNK
jgi:hypothetical protein